MLSDHEQRVLEELEGNLSTGPYSAAEPPVGRPGLAPGVLALATLGCLGVVLLMTGVAVAAFALATATAIGWLFWRMWAHRADGSRIAAPLLLGAGHGRSGPRRRPGASIRRYLRWLAEAE